MKPQPEEWVLKPTIEGYEEGRAGMEGRKRLGRGWSVMAEVDEGCGGHGKE